MNQMVYENKSILTEINDIYLLLCKDIKEMFYKHHQVLGYF